MKNNHKDGFSQEEQDAQRARIRTAEANLRASRGQQATPGFAIQILRDTDLGIATLIVEDEEGHYEPINFAGTLAEGFEMAKDDLRFRQTRLENDEDPGFCPFEYKLWARGIDGKLLVAATWNVSDL